MLDHAFKQEIIVLEEKLAHLQDEEYWRDRWQNCYESVSSTKRLRDKYLGGALGGNREMAGFLQELREKAEMPLSMMNQNMIAATEIDRMIEGKISDYLLQHDSKYRMFHEIRDMAEGALLSTYETAETHDACIPSLLMFNEAADRNQLRAYSMDIPETIDGRFIGKLRDELLHTLRSFSSAMQNKVDRMRESISDTSYGGTRFIPKGHGGENHESV